MTSVPLLDLQAQYRPLRDEILAAIDARLRQPALHHGPGGRRRSSDELARDARRRATPSASRPGTDALLLALMALGIGPGDEVITTTYSFFATAGADRPRSARGRCWSTSIRSTFNIDPEPSRRRDHAADARPSCRSTCSA